jgi:hypothetical protein
MLVSERALFQRVGRALAKDGRKLVVNRSEGCWSVIALDRNAHERDIHDLEREGRKLGVLKPWESLES